MISNIIFDLGNVLLDFKPTTYLEKKYDNKELSEKLYSEVFCSKEWIDLDCGTLTGDEAAEIIAARNPHIASHVKAVMNDWDEILSPIEGTIELLGELKAQDNCRLYLLSNFHRSAFSRVSEKYGFFRLFDGMVVSSDLQLIKPDPAIFRHLIDTYSLNPSESVFIDDMPYNTEAAQKLGMDSIQFTTDKALRKELEHRGVFKGLHNVPHK